MGFAAHNPSRAHSNPSVTRNHMNIQQILAWPCGLAGLVVLGLGLAGCSESQPQAGPPAPPPPAVDVVTLHARPVTLTTDLPGRTSAYRTAEVRPQVSGVLLKRLFNEGDMVHAGQQLYQIDPAPYEAALASARATLAHAEASVRTAQAAVDRYTPLMATHAVSKQDFDNAIGTLEQDKADVASAEAAVKTASINLTYTKVLSPIDGRTSRSSVTEGALVTASQTTALVTVTQLDPIYVDVTQATTTILRLKRELASGQITSIGEGKIPVRLQLEDGSAYDQTGTLQFSEVTVDQGTGAVTLRAIFQNKDGLLLPGMFVREQLQEGIVQNGILAPQQGVTHNQKGQPTALIVDPDGKVQLRILKTDRAIGTDWLVSGGLKDGDRLIVSGVQKARPGMPVTVNEAAMGGAEAAPGRQASAESRATPDAR
jgi:membrane fusion protein, multidrug efflux system